MTEVRSHSSGALAGIRVCDFCGQLAGAGATRWLAAMGAEVIRVEDPVTGGAWDTHRGGPPYKDGITGIEAGGAFQHHNVGKLGVTINMRDPRGLELAKRLIEVSDAVTENFSAGVLERWGLSYDDMCRIRADIVYVSHSGFGHSGPYREHRTWGPIVQAVSGLYMTSGFPELPPAGWGFSYMDHIGGYLMALGVVAGIVRRDRTGTGSRIDLAGAEAGLSLLGREILDVTVNGRPFGRPGMPHGNLKLDQHMAPHGVYRCAGDDEWVAIACTDDADFERLRGVVGMPPFDRLHDLEEVDQQLYAWTAARSKFDVAQLLQGKGIAAAPVRTPRERIDEDPFTQAWGLWPTVRHPVMGDVRVDGLGVHLSKTDWTVSRPAPMLGQHNDDVFGSLLGLTPEERSQLRESGVI